MKKFLIISMIVVGAVSLFALSVLNNQTSSLFSGSGKCQACHESDGNALSYQGKDVSPVTLWRSTMMAHSAKDPLWRAVVSEESHAHPEVSDVIESTCTRCHAPMGNRQAREDGSQTFNLSDLYADKLAQDGVSCTACHQIKNSEFENNESYSGMYEIDNSRKIFGPYENPLSMPMKNNVNYTPEYRKAIAHSELCATCHTLFAPFFDNDGNIAGTFPEQTPYLEWKISDYPQQGKSCQECHMPRIDDGIDIATTPVNNTTLRSPFWKHDFVGGNAYMLGILKNMEAGGSEMSGNATQFDQTIARTNANLKSAVDVKFNKEGDFIKVEVTNLTGHKLPSGIPFRRMWLEMIIKDQDNVVVYQSGTPTENGKLLEDPNNSPEHRDTILSEDQIQIWEATPADVDGKPTFALLKASNFKKDNRIPPKGFNRNAPTYDSCAIYGKALDDPNFGANGSDIVYYKLPDLKNGDYTVSVNLLYQTVKPGLVDYIKDVSTTEINDFVTLYDNNPNIPAVLYSGDQIITLSSIEENSDGTSIYYNDNKLLISSKVAVKANLLISDMNGRIVYKEEKNLARGKNTIYLDKLTPNAAYVVNMNFNSKKLTYKFIR